MIYHTLFLTHPALLGLNVDDVESHGVFSAEIVRELVDTRRTPNHEEVLKYLDDHGGTMMEVSAAGVVVGEWLVRPRLLDEYEYRLLMRVKEDEYWHAKRLKAQLKRETPR